MVVREGEPSGCERGGAVFNGLNTSAIYLHFVGFSCKELLIKSTDALKACLKIHYSKLAFTI